MHLCADHIEAGSQLKSRWPIDNKTGFLQDATRVMERSFSLVHTGTTAVVILPERLSCNDHTEQVFPFTLIFLESYIFAQAAVINGAFKQKAFSVLRLLVGKMIDECIRELAD